MGALEPFLVSSGLVALAEVGDKSMVLGILLTLRFRRPWPVFGGMVAGLTLNLAIAATLGALLADWLGGDWFTPVLAVIFLLMAGWALWPEDDDEEEEEAVLRRYSGHGVFLTAAAGFFLLEMADKTQVAALTLAARYDAVLPVLAGAVAGVVAINAPAIWLGQQFAGRLPVRTMHVLAAVLFAVLGIWMLLDWWWAR